MLILQDLVPTLANCIALYVFSAKIGIYVRFAFTVLVSLLFVVINPYTCLPFLNSEFLYSQHYVYNVTCRYAFVTNYSTYWANLYTDPIEEGNYSESQET